jgi:metal-responsive CopG/Arc/MetJ family transcriptional regulator
MKEVAPMKMVRILIQVPTSLKAKLDALRAKGTTASGFIRSVLERELKNAPTGQKGRER